MTPTCFDMKLLQGCSRNYTLVAKGASPIAHPVAVKLLYSNTCSILGLQLPICLIRSTVICCHFSKYCRSKLEAGSLHLVIKEPWKSNGHGRLWLFWQGDHIKPLYSPRANHTWSL